MLFYIFVIYVKNITQIIAFIGIFVYISVHIRQLRKKY